MDERVSKGDTIQFRPRSGYIVGDRYEVHDVNGGRVYFHSEEVGMLHVESGYGSTTIDGWLDLKRRSGEGEGQMMGGHD